MPEAVTIEKSGSCRSHGNGAEAAPRQSLVSTQHPPISSTQVPGLYVSMCLHKLPIHITSHTSASSCLQCGLLHVIVSWLRRGGKAGNRRRRRKIKRREREGGGEEQKGSFETAVTSSFHSPLLLPPPKKKVMKNS